MRFASGVLHLVTSSHFIADAPLPTRSACCRSAWSNVAPFISQLFYVNNRFPIDALSYPLPSTIPLYPPILVFLQCPY